MRRDALPLLACLLVLAGCENAMQDMYDQPHLEEGEATTLFPDGRVLQAPPPGAVARAAGVRADSSGGRLGVADAGADAGPPGRSGRAPPWGHGEPEQPLPAMPGLPLTRAVLERGRDRYRINCEPCHGALGDGDGTLPRRGFPPPPSFHEARLRAAPDAHLYAVITHGYGVMYPYGDRVVPADRTAIVQWIRTLQLSQHFPAAALAPGERHRLDEASP
ncbi:c-type cytochrome [Coralloluteibacterium stylophorae]|uniref:Cytochrome c n=1 Tax=Coralloluteibacterium stylophorae TaxID=1776034 RepID=A0A8J7VQQ0_9GAMM|nr:cytochrome c [Coralloluteibacterium stylophorae]MBS7456396.1 cytochrome c [Coralloluteibacterium stylophorae]